MFATFTKKRKKYIKSILHFLREKERKEGKKYVHNLVHNQPELELDFMTHFLKMKKEKSIY